MNMYEIMTLEEVAQYLKLTPQTIYAWAQQGKIPAAKLGKEWRFRRDLIDAWFVEHLEEQFKPLAAKVERKAGEGDHS